jgi:ATP-dependent RNA helicase MRH4
LNTDTPKTFGSGLREDRELEEGAYDAPETADEFFHPPEPVTLASSAPVKGKGKSQSVFDADTLPSPSASASFTSPPLLPGFVSALEEIFGPHAQPTPIQSLSIAHCLPSKPVDGAPGWKQFLLASETGSGKSGPGADARARAPAGGLCEGAAARGEAARALREPRERAEHHKAGGCKQRGADGGAVRDGAYANRGREVERRQAHPVGVVVGTPMKLLEMVRGRGWDRIEEEEAERAREEEDDVDEEGRPRVKPRRGRDKMVHYGTWRAKPELGLANLEWVVVDEADVLFGKPSSIYFQVGRCTDSVCVDPDFQETTRTLLADISAARGHVLPPSASIPVPPTLGQPSSPTTLSNPIPAPAAPSSSASAITSTSNNTPIDYPFNLILTSATIPKSLNAYLSTYHPTLVRLASPQLHRLPRTLQTEYVGWTGGNKFADVARRIKRVWAEDAASGHASGKAHGAELSKVLVFCNRSAKVEEFAAYLEGQGVKSVALTSRSEARGRGSNRHLDGFLRTRNSSSSSVRPVTALTPTSTTSMPADPKAHPHVLITTSLLSRGLDFAPDIRHVFIVDEPRNTVDFLHRAGRTGRAGQWGKVVIFGKLKGRGSQRTKEVRKRIQGLRS